jgi:hypothetical protein
MSDAGVQCRVRHPPCNRGVTTLKVWDTPITTQRQTPDAVVAFLDDGVGWPIDGQGLASGGSGTDNQLSGMIEWDHMTVPVSER